MGEWERKNLDSEPTCSRIHSVYAARLSPAVGVGGFGASQDKGWSQEGQEEKEPEWGRIRVVY